MTGWAFTDEWTNEKITPVSVLLPVARDLLFALNTITKIKRQPSRHKT